MGENKHVLQVRGYSRGGIARELYKRSKVDGSVKEVPETPMEADVRFDKVKVAFDKDNNMRPYFHFTFGRIESVLVKNVRDFAPELNADEVRVVFDAKTMPEVSCKWQLSNNEIANLVPKCLFGSDYSVDHGSADLPNLRPKDGDCMKLAEEFTAFTWEGIPFSGTVRMIASEYEGRTVPIISVTPELEDNELVTNSRVSGYLDISGYIPDKEYMPAGYTDSFTDIMSVEDGLPEPSAEPKPFAGINKDEPKYMTPEQKKEADYMSGLSGEVNENMEARLTGRDVDYAVQSEKTVQSGENEVYVVNYDMTFDGDEILVDPYEDASQKGEAFNYEELVAFGLIDPAFVVNMDAETDGAKTLPKESRPVDTVNRQTVVNKKEEAKTNQVATALETLKNFEQRKHEEQDGLGF